jgi:uncharacterized protein YlxP (DUF503 family)
MGKLGRPPLEVVVSVMEIISFFTIVLNTFYQSWLESVESVELCYTSFMKVGVSQITLHLPGCHSLKDKRQVIKSVMARIRQQFEVAIAEVDEQDRWQIAKLGVSYVSNSSQHIDEILGRVERFIEETRPDVIVTNTEVEIINW